MIDIRLILHRKEYLKRELSKKNYDPASIDRIEEVLKKIKTLETEHNKLCRRRKAVSRDSEVDAADKRALRENIAHIEKELAGLRNEANSLLLNVPNLPDESAPVGFDAGGNVVITRAEDYYRCPVPNPVPHWDIAKTLGIMDTSAAGRISGSGFGMFFGKGAKLLRALVNYCLIENEEKYEEILPPHLVTPETLTYTGHLPKFSAEQYKCERDDLWLIPTAEVPLTAVFANTVFPRETLPVRRMGYTLAFRRETGSPGTHTRGLQRIHEFHKVELFKITESDACDRELRDLLGDCLKIISALGLQYRVVDLCTGEMGDKYARCYDIEVYSPGVRKWLEVSSVGHFSDYQARRAGIKYIDKNGVKRFAYTMNGSGIATPRVWAAIAETYQQPDGSILVPEVLRSLMGCERII